MSRRRLPPERKSLTHRFTLAGTNVYVTVGLYVDGSPGEVFLTCSKVGSLERGLLDTLAVMISMLLQQQVPLEVVCKKLCSVKFEPSGLTGNTQIPTADSIVDYLGKWLWLKFGRKGGEDGQGS
jgi:ribonucleoside-diphosphate reductase alpha chain